MSKLARGTPIFGLAALLAVSAAAQAPSTEKPDTVAAAPADFDQKINDATKIREQREQDIIKMIDGLRADLLKFVEEGKNDGDRRNVALLQKINDLQGLLSKQIDGNKAFADARVDALAQRVNDLKSGIDDLKKGISPRVAIIISILTAIAGFLVSWAITRSNRTHADNQRTEDIARAARERKEDIDSAATQRTDDIKRAQDQRTDDINRSDQQRTQESSRADQRRRQGAFLSIVGAPTSATA